MCGYWLGILNFSAWAFGPLRDDVAGADQFDVRALRQVRQVHVRHAAAADHGDPNALRLLLRSRLSLRLLGEHDGGGHAT